MSSLADDSLETRVTIMIKVVITECRARDLRREVKKKGDVDSEEKGGPQVARRVSGIPG